MLSASFTVKIKGMDPSTMDKQMTFAVASSLTFVAKEAQTAIIKEIEGAFTVRTNWDKQSNALGVKVKPATKTNLASMVGTAAAFLEKFVQGPDNSIIINTPRGQFFAVPTTNVRRTKRDIVSAIQRPQRLRGKRDFVIPMRSGKGYLLYQRPARGKAKPVLLYILTPRAKIRERDVIFGPSQRVFERRFSDILTAQMEKALATAR
jgi:hypothetical protein